MVRDGKIDFKRLVSGICRVHERIAAQANKAVNFSLTLRNWAIGCYIREYEQYGVDRAKYGQRLLEMLAEELQQALDKCYSGRYLQLCRQFYEAYPQIRKSVISEFGFIEEGKSIFPDQVVFQGGCEKRSGGKVGPPMRNPVDKVIERLSFTHIVELIKLGDPLKRAFYEIECIRGNWSVRELRRQINSLYYERSGLSENKEKLSELVHAGAEQVEPRLPIRDPYVFEFLGLKPKEVMSESELEHELIDKLQEFLMELGHGFCFEARQKRLLIGDTHGFIDLVLYHRILKCHVLVELKLDRFSHEYLGQLNTYVTWYRKNVMTDGDNPPVGILLCRKKDHTLVEYALAGMDNHLFVSKYQLELPSKENIQRFLEEKIKEVGNGR